MKVVYFVRSSIEVIVSRTCVTSAIRPCNRLGCSSFELSIYDVLENFGVFVPCLNIGQDFSFSAKCLKDYRHSSWHCCARKRETGGVSQLQPRQYGIGLRLGLRTVKLLNVPDD